MIGFDGMLGYKSVLPCLVGCRACHGDGSMLMQQVLPRRYGWKPYPLGGDLVSPSADSTRAARALGAKQVSGVQARAARWGTRWRSAPPLRGCGRWAWLPTGRCEQ